jgi:hypothetical protein
MTELPDNEPSHDGRPADRAAHDSSRGADLAAEADVRLAGYPAKVRGEFIDLLRILSKKQGEVELRVSRG